ncbi:major facilitator superfamily domain-containing protein [Microdochium trichocladiopsis]|uniref:Major facilitator superfamily domain-containing protein n=1 Tax=Microdochium trichocladiopsis TaxID=1682393 RepID=A0A9P8Y5N4_9PEZI|nr:major facilitator superfamily domain-containing protein [Microdochium trichocladiopsis]KAH7028041.1 major facilitator superfamily domain-containing protein [Microdochium trichocladiopsis]
MDQAVSQEKSSELDGSRNQNNVELSSAGETKPEASSSDKAESTTKEEPEDESKYPSGMRLGLVMLALCLAVFLMSLDNSIISTAIPKITDEFNSLGDIGWYGSAYLLTTASLQLVYGKFYSFLPIKLVYLAAIFIFEVGSVLCGAATSSQMLIVGRAIAGVGAAGVFSGSLIILAHSAPLRRRPLYTGLIGGVYGISSVAGPLLGGAFTDGVTWRWCFYINLPIGGLALGVIAIFFPEPARKIDAAKGWKDRIMSFDPIGTAVLIPDVICLLLALQWGGTTYAWSDGRIIALLVLFSVLLITWILLQYFQGERATVPGRIIRPRSVWSACLFSMCCGAVLFVAIYYLPIWFQVVKGASAVQSGIDNLALILGVTVGSIFGGALTTVWGQYAPLMVAGAALSSVGFGLITTFSPDTESGRWIGYQALAGFGLGLGTQQPIVAVQNVLALIDVPTGTTLLVFVQTISGAIFNSVAQSVFTNKLQQNIIEYTPGLNPAIVLGTGATAVQSSIPAEYLDGVRLAYNNALNRVMLIPAVIAAVSVIFGFTIEWRSVKGKDKKNADVSATLEAASEPQAEAGKGKHKKSCCA